MKRVRLGQQDRIVVLRPDVAEGTQKTILVEKQDEEETAMGVVIVETGFAPVILWAGDRVDFLYQNGRWIAPEIVYGILQSKVIHQLYAVRLAKKTEGDPYDDVDALLDKAWRSKSNERDYYGLKKSAARWVSRMETHEMELLGFCYDAGFIALPA